MPSTWAWSMLGSCVNEVVITEGGFFRADTINFILMRTVLIFLLIINSTISLAISEFEGFFTPSDLSQFPLSSPEKSVFKIEIAPNAHGTAFSIANDIIVTNVHNITRCLREHGYVDTGYDGSKGPLDCNSLAIILPDSTKVKGIKLLGSNSRYSNKGWDFAIMKLPGLNATPVNLSKTGVIAGESVFVVGFPGATHRSKEVIDKKLASFIELFDAIFEAQSKIDAIDSNNKTSQEIMQLFIEDSFTKLQLKATWSNFLSGSLIGRTWNPLLAWQNENADIYYSHLVNHINLFKKDSFILLSMLEKALRVATPDYPDADDSFKVSKAVHYRDAEPGVKILRGDATPGSSGSLVVNKTGDAVAILFQIRSLNPNSKELCSLDAIMTDLESIKFNYCPALGPAVVSSEAIHKKLLDWGISLQ